ncbi:MAG: ATP-binding protein, partial [Cystobacter sp.]
FEPFFSTRATSSGLGLSVSHAIVTGLGGTLRADSREGHGTRLSILLPAMAGNAPGEDDAPEGQERAAGGGVTPTAGGE